MSRATSNVPKKKRVGWTEPETNALIGIWHEEDVSDAIQKKMHTEEGSMGDDQLAPDRRGI